MLKVMEEYSQDILPKEAYSCLNLSTHKVIESAHVNVDEFAEKTIEESRKEPEDYRRFIFIDTIPDTSVNKRTIPIEPMIAKLEQP